MFALEIRDHIMIAHSLKGEVFGPAQRMHGATFIVDVAFFRDALDPDNIVVDIGRAGDALRQILADLNYANLDEHPAFQGMVTTTEFLARHIFERMADQVHAGTLGPHAAGIDRIRVTLGESHLARAWFEAPLAR
jgi:6-pyruvoyl-tetrahydropterin synthase